MRNRIPLLTSGITLATSVATLLAVWSGCGTRSSGGVHAAGADRMVHIRPGTGPIDDLTVLRDTDGHFVVAGVCLFPEGTRLTVSAADSAGVERGRSQVVVEHALFQSLPLGQGTGPEPPGRYAVRLEATFASGMQPEPVIREVGDGSRFQGEGMTRTRQGRTAYVRIFEVRL